MRREIIGFTKYQERGFVFTESQKTNILKKRNRISNVHTRESGGLVIHKSDDVKDMFTSNEEIKEILFNGLLN